MPAISIIIPIYNVEKYLRRCLESVQNQTFTDWEAICVNDGSPDNSADIVREFAARDARFKLVNKENGGLSDARNAGMAVASGEYILYLDSDDFIHPQTFEKANAVVTVPGVAYHYMFNENSALNSRDVAHRARVKQQYQIGKQYRKDFARKHKIMYMWRTRKIINFFR